MLYPFHLTIGERGIPVPLGLLSCWKTSFSLRYLVEQDRDIVAVAAIIGYREVWFAIGIEIADRHRGRVCPHSEVCGGAERRTYLCKRCGDRGVGY